jgi:glycosyltransferase involved in cell wall biosynthesis
LSTTKLDKKSNFENRRKAIYICPSNLWGARERTVLRDALISKDMGLEPLIYCLKDSYLDLEAKQSNLEVIHHYGKIQTRFIKWYKLFGLGKIVREEDVALVHCYHLNFLWPLSFFLKSRPEIPLFFTTHKEISKSYREFYHKALLSRVDHFFVSSAGLVSNLMVHMDIPPRKIQVLGFGNEVIEISRTEASKVKKDLSFDKEVWTLGTFLSSHHTSPENVLPLIYAVMGFNQKKQDESARLILICDRNWNEVLIYQELIRLIKDLGSEDDVYFYSGVSLGTFQKSIDIWLSAETSENLEDLAIGAVFQGTPVLVPRTSSSKELFGKWGEVGLTYKAGDARDLRDQLCLMVEKNRRFIRQIAKITEELMESNHFEHYKERLHDTYHNIFAARQRVSRRRHSKPPSQTV